MNILILPDSFKNCLSSVEVGSALSEGIWRVFPEAKISSYPVADGGEGTVEAFVAAMQGKIITCPAHDALGREIEAFYGLLPDGTAVIEVAAASGIERLSSEEKNPLIASSYGTGEIIKEVLQQGIRKVILGLGGSVTNDGGMGMASALGFRFLNSNGEEIAEGGGALNQLDNIDTSEVLPELKDCEFQIACDVQSPLCGPEGASAVFGPQKGATPLMVKLLDANLSHFAQVIKKDLDKDIASLPGAGAAGGLGAGAVAFLNGQLIPGFDIVTAVLGLKDKVKQADIVITGEGKIDAQTLQGKTPFAVAQLAKAEGKKVLAFAGYLGSDHRILYQHGIDAIFPIADRPMSLDESLSNAAYLLSNASERAFRMLK